MTPNSKFVSRSQAGQDAFVHALIPRADGLFLDIGCGHPIEINNTYALEQIGWRGVLLDSDAVVAELALKLRASPIFQGDARSFDWKPFVSPVPMPIDYASIDVDEHTHDALANLLRQSARPAILTVEHDFYQRGDRLRIPNFRLLTELGYDLLCSNVHSNGCSFEDWFVAPDKVNMSRANLFRSEGKEWQAILKQGGL